MPRHKFRTRESYSRRGPTREPYDVVLIVCEGQKTEPFYFEGLRAAYGLSSANIVVRPMGRDPLSLVDFAISELERDDTFTHAYCVFDRDGHATFDAAIQKSRDCALGKRGRLRLAVSVPCFEIWPLLHFRFSSAAIVAGGGKTPGEKALALLQNEMPDYLKGSRGIFEKLAPKLDAALQYAEKLCQHNQESDSDNPSTTIHDLVNYLMRLKQ